jgi:hypothetical protein
VATLTAELARLPARRVEIEEQLLQGPMQDLEELGVRIEELENAYQQWDAKKAAADMVLAEFYSITRG